MDVILDSNIVCSDYQMRSARFAGLFDYLKRTDSSLVILDCVREEVLATHKRELKARNKAARNAWDALQELLSASRTCAFPDFGQEQNHLRSQLSPRKVGGLSIISFKCDLDAVEIVRRGAYRIPPAREDGEELRDVIIWLTALQYVREKEQPVAFITMDSGFWAEGQVRNPIQEDIAACSKLITLYKDVESFLKNNNLKEEPVAGAWVLSRLQVASFERQIIERIPVPFGREVQRLRDMKFKGGTLYDITNESQYAEITYSYVIEYKPFLETAFTALLELFNQSSKTYGGAAATSSTSTDSTILDPATNFLSGPSPTMSLPLGVDPISKGTAQFSLRLVNGDVVRRELDQVALDPHQYQVQWAQPRPARK